MRITEQDKAIIVCAQLQADASCATIARACGYKEHTVRHSLKKLEQHGLIKRYPYINLHALGFENFILNFSLNPASTSSSRVIDFIAGSERTAWLSHRTGDFQWAASLFMRSSAEMLSFLDALTEVADRPFLHKEVVLHVSCHLFPRKYLCVDNSRIKDFKVEPLRYGHLAQTVDISEMDHKILSALSAHAAESTQEIARRIGVPLSTVSYRISLLKERQVISGFAYAFHPQEVSIHVLRFLVSFKGLSRKLREEVFEFCKAHPNVSSLISCIGNWDYEIKVEAIAEAEVNVFIAQFYRKFSDYILSTKTFSLFKPQKLNYYPFKEYSTVTGNVLRIERGDVKLKQAI
jgi:Lrp/AsnC family leucine-responsive transcriptional regulator